ncbi:hypothetical protein DH2020_003287 [Rehmannia glutinosa]|uniref:Uncharacterized protein n=1 Tax=Rehmannia glutinosa TaxID=99300 RepID=A0ABR0XL71_REHGL
MRFVYRNKAHSFGHPNVEIISSRFLNENGLSGDADKLLEAHHKANISQQTLELNQLERQMYLEKKRACELKQARKVDINKLDYDQLCHLEGAIRNFQQEYEAKVQNATIFQMPRSSIGPSFAAPFSCDHAQYGNRGTISRGKGKSICGGSYAPIRYDPGVGSSNAQVGST